MTEAHEVMLHLEAMGCHAAVCYSSATGKWYVTTGVEVGGDGMLSSITRHETDIYEAINAYFEEMRSVRSPKYLVTYSNTDSRRHWRWNGVTFAQLPIEADS